MTRDSEPYSSARELSYSRSALCPNSQHLTLDWKLMSHEIILKTGVENPEQIEIVQTKAYTGS